MCCRSVSIYARDCNTSIKPSICNDYLRTKQGTGENTQHNYNFKIKPTKYLINGCI